MTVDQDHYIPNFIIKLIFNEEKHFLYFLKLWNIFQTYLQTTIS